MKLVMIGLGKMGFNLALNLIDNNLEVIAFEVDCENVIKRELPRCHRCLFHGRGVGKAGITESDNSTT